MVCDVDDDDACSAKTCDGDALSPAMVCDAPCSAKVCHDDDDACSVKVCLGDALCSADCPSGDGLPQTAVVESVLVRRFRGGSAGPHRFAM